MEDLDVRSAMAAIAEGILAVGGEDMLSAGDRALGTCPLPIGAGISDTVEDCSLCCIGALLPGGATFES